MRILAFSDVRRWEGYEEILDMVKPDVVCLAGDLTSDGGAAFWSKALTQIPAYRQEVIEKLRELGVEFVWEEHVPYPSIMISPLDPRRLMVMKEILSIEEKYRKSREFHEIVKRIHVEKFYHFLEYAGRRSRVLVVRGDHDYDFEGDYDVNRINGIPGCSEISGRFVEIGGMRFLGLGFEETHYRQKLREIVAMYRGRVDVVVAHSELSRIPIIAELKPKLIIGGHFLSGKYLVNNIPAAFTAGIKYAVIDIDQDAPPKITLYDYRGNIVKPEAEQRFRRRLYERYEWLKPYPEDI
ncbi:metallophosphoesterase [Ignisphaera aggregans DSM 17230]|uniref:Metallophosphoesterase n=1 Tax=Ignisphaera aggregans (strain DSM 17230 / JCM 13409 / AQ1.S1) TaxID=583356 RepID=E0ST74_IGNAA|nr:metallophosphoesterase [Ignisphaera aggregans DSM 17230]